MALIASINIQDVRQIRRKKLKTKTGLYNPTIFGTCNRCKLCIMLYYVGKKQNGCTKAETGWRPKLVEELVWFSFVYFVAWLLAAWFLLLFDFHFGKQMLSRTFTGPQSGGGQISPNELVLASGGHPSEHLCRISKGRRLSALSADKRLELSV